VTERLGRLASKAWASREKRWLLLILLAGAAARVGAAIFFGNRMEPVPGAYDQIFYHDLGLNLLAGKGFAFTRPPWPFIEPGAPTAYYSYVYPMFLAAVYAVFGPHALAARIVQALICGLLPYQVWVLTKPVMGGGREGRVWEPRRSGERAVGGPPDNDRSGSPRAETVALVAAAITAFYAYFILYSASLQTEGLYLVLVAWALILTLKLAERPTWQRWLGWGLAVTLASLTRQVFMPMALLFFFFIVFKARRSVKLWHVAMAGAVAVVLILPFTVRNYRVFGRFLLLNSQYGQVLWNANHPDLGTDFEAAAMFPIPADLEGADEVVLTNALLKRGISFITADPGRFVQLSLSRAATLFMFWPSRYSSLMSNISRSLSFMVCLPFMIAGLALSLREWRRWLLLYLFIAAYALLHIVSWAQIRYRMPIDVVLIPFAAVALVSLAGRIRRKSLRSEPAPGSSA